MNGFLSRCPLCFKLLTHSQRLVHHHYCTATRHEAHVHEWQLYTAAQERDIIIAEQADMAAEYRSCGESYGS